MDKHTHLGDRIKAFLKQNLLKTTMNILQVLQEHKIPPMQTLNCLYSCKWLQVTNKRHISGHFNTSAELKAADCHGRDINAEVIS